ncbi:NUDIX domain-containing protein [Agarilytica rhodophyticola]|uniref:NUDIX domain-containing protein n=1 Tax=Agarilytica rhodophyticola TaxID=1737490 RepID=UPI000B34706A|nr:NUDIX hydrolase [Agarilytica rhodophyticola]
MKKKIAGWCQLKQEVVYENPWIRVTHEDVTRPNGSEGIYGVVHFKNQAVGIVAIDDEDNTWLVRQSRYALNQYTWEIPEGGSPIGEDPLSSAKRELNEEVGLVADNWQPLMTLHTSNSVTDEVGFIFVARGLSAGQQALEESEDIEVRKLPLKEAIEMAMNGEITDAMSIAALLKLALSRVDS